jgi:hypothetical protein
MPRAYPVLAAQNPRLLDTGEVIARSNTQLIAAQMSVGLLPHGTVMIDGSSHPAAAVRGAERKNVKDANGPSDALIPVEQANALVPSSQTVDGLLLQRAPPAGVAAWGPRPAENSPYDQLVLHNPDEEFMLDRVALFELFARHRANPEYWTAPRLAALYGTKAEWVEVVLESAAPPVLCTVDGELYGTKDRRPGPQKPLAHRPPLNASCPDAGVFAVRSLEDMASVTSKELA